MELVYLNSLQYGQEFILNDMNYFLISGLFLNGNTINVYARNGKGMVVVLDANSKVELVNG